jgi:hypothetical protein
VATTPSFIFSHAHLCAGGLDRAEQPHQDVERVRAQVAEGPHAGDLRVGHPAPGLGHVVGLLVEPAPEGAAVAVPRGGVGDAAERALRELLAQEEHLRVGPHEVAGREEDAGLLDRPGHRAALGAGHSERLLHEHVLPRLRRGLHQLAVTESLRGDEHSFHLGVGQDLVHGGGGAGPYRDPHRVGVEGPLHADVRPLG